MMPSSHSSHSADWLTEPISQPQFPPSFPNHEHFHISRGRQTIVADRSADRSATARYDRRSDRRLYHFLKMLMAFPHVRERLHQPGSRVIVSQRPVAGSICSRLLVPDSEA